MPQLAHPTDNSPSLKPDEAINVYQLLGIVLYYVCAVDLEMLVTLNTIAAKQLKNHPGDRKKIGAASQLFGHPS